MSNEKKKTINDRLIALEIKMKLIIWLIIFAILQITTMIMWVLKPLITNLMANGG